jgi:hypothetical protein
MSQVSREEAIKLKERKLNGESVVDLAKEAGVTAQYLYNKFSHLKLEGKHKSRTKTRAKKAKAHVFTELPLMAPTPQLASSTKQFAVAIVPTTSLREFLGEVFR